MAMVAGSRCSGRASTKAIITIVKHHERLLEQQPIGDGFLLPHRHDARLALGRGAEAPAPDQVDHDQLHRQHDDDDRREVDDKGIEVEADLRTDQDVGWIADQGRGAADVGGEDFREQIGIGRHVELAGDGERDRHDQQHGGDVVEQRRDNRGGDLQQQQNPRGMRLGGRCPDHTATYWNMPERRETDTRIIMPVRSPDGVPVDAFERLVLVLSRRR